FAIMGLAYWERVFGVPNPRVGLVSNGEEEGKGSMLARDAYQLLKQTRLNFVGNVEGKDVPLGLADVAVTDGFTGNVMIKLSEGVAEMLVGFLKEEIKKRPLAVAGAVLARPAFEALRKRLDYSEYGGGPLLGVDGVVIVAHGRSNAYAIKNAVRVAKEAVDRKLVEAIREGVR
ncbi:MAG: phosphate--acyl-ACP acyltransferase, partial [Chloroflexi bacterium]|nr:phosphate--acyl-ACP acyltransferase [Chloroflexota bacterium]